MSALLPVHCQRHALTHKFFLYVLEVAIFKAQSNCFSIVWICYASCCDCLHCNVFYLCFTEIQRNRDFYRYSDVRPPFTYATL